MATTKPMTIDDVMELAADSDDHFELIEGELIRMSPATPEHGWIGQHLTRRIGNHVEERRLGELFDASTGYVFASDPETLLEPDLTFIRADRLPPDDAWGSFFTIAPDLVVEIRSPSERRAHIQRKISIYLDAGVRLVWYVDPRRQSVTIYAPHRAPLTLGIGDELDGEDVLPGFHLPVAALFRRATDVS